jgi:hypothetical protein
MYRQCYHEQGRTCGDGGGGDNGGFQARELGFEDSKIGGEYGRWKNEEEGVFYPYNSKNMAHMPH